MIYRNIRSGSTAASLAVALAVTGAVLLPAPAYAAGEISCGVVGSNVTVTSNTAGKVWIGQTEEGNIGVGFNQDFGLDCGTEQIGAADKNISVTSPAGTDWVIDTAIEWNSIITLSSHATDDLTVVGYETSDYWSTPTSTPGTLDINLDVDGFIDVGYVELVLTTPVATSTFQTNEGSDFVDLSNWSTAAGGHTETEPGEGTDGVVGSPGDDHVYVSPDDEVDSVDADQAGTDTLFFDSEDPVTYDGDPTVDDGADGEGDDYVGFENVWGGTANDRLVGGDTGGTLHGGFGNDVLVGGSGNDTLAGDQGFDTISFHTPGGAAVTVDNDSATGQGSDTLSDGHTEKVIGSDNVDTFTISDPGAIVQPAKGADQVTASVVGVTLLADSTPDGSDTFDSPVGGIWDYSQRSSRVEVTTVDDGPQDGGNGEGDDVQLLSVVGGKAGDLIEGTGASEELEGGGGNDTIKGWNGEDIISGGSGKDTIDAGFGDDYVAGGSGNDSIVGGHGDDEIHAGSGDDVINDHAGDDVDYGDDGNDVFQCRALAVGADQMYGGAGIDTASYNGRKTAVRLSNDGKANDGYANEKDLIGRDVEGLTGGDGADFILGGARGDVLNGNAGADSVNGSSGNDKVTGGKGKDLLRGGAGKDRINSKDKEADKVFGGPGLDKGRKDRFDLVVQVEGAF